MHRLRNFHNQLRDMDSSGPSHPTNRPIARGRPRKRIEQRDELYEVRRERNRQSQRLFHARRAAESTQNANRIAHLEQTIEKLGNIFIELADELLGSSLPRFDPQLSRRLHGSMQDALSLLKETADQPHRHDSTTENSSKSLPNTSESTGHLPIINPWALQSDHLGCLRSRYEPRTGTCPDNIPGLEVNVASNASSSGSYHQDGGLSREPNLSTANIFGNGWMDRVPAAFGSLSAEKIVNQLQEGSLAVNIVSYSLYYAYHALWESHDPSNRIFRHAIKTHPREELLFNLRWFLGPGYNEMYRLAGVTFNTLIHDWPSNMPSLQPIIDSEVIFDADGRHFDRPANEARIINANDVASYLASKLPRYAGGELLELTIDDSNDGRLEPSLSKPYSEGPTTFLNMDLFFPSATGWRPVGSGISKAMRKQNILISRSTLFKNLSNISLCLSYGPGFWKQNLEGAVLASAID